MISEMFEFCVIFAHTMPIGNRCLATQACVEELVQDRGFEGDDADASDPERLLA
jgi:hypothetical protein